MISSFMLPQTCRIFRTAEDGSQSFVTTQERLIGEYPCYISQKQSVVQSQADTQHIVTANLEVLMNLPADIVSGDRLESESRSYVVGLVYKPANRHIQADIHQEEES